MTKKKVSLDEALKVLEEHGYKAKPTQTYSRHTFQVQEELLKEFFTTIKKRKYKIKDAVNEAFRDWIAKK